TYPELPSRVSLRLAEADSVARRGDEARAARLYRDIDLLHPGEPPAREARERLRDLQQRGVALPTLGAVERVDRGERLAWSGPIPEAREAVVALLSDAALSGALRLRVYAMAARLARVEGRFGERARSQEAARTGSLAPAPAAEAAPDLAARRAAA